MKKNKGFTLAELLVVVAIIAILVAISIPVFTSQLHKARISTDWANLRAYYTELQYDYMENETYIDAVKKHGIVSIDNSICKLEEGTAYLSTANSGNGYAIVYYDNKGHEEHNLTIGN